MPNRQIRPMRRMKGHDLEAAGDGLQAAASDYAAEVRRLKVMHGADWHRPTNTGVLEEIERRIRRHTRRLAAHPRGWKLPCWCAECESEPVTA